MGSRKNPWGQTERKKKPEKIVRSLHTARANATRLLRGDLGGTFTGEEVQPGIFKKRPVGNYQWSEFERLK
jgi:hypothetical protein